MLIPYAVKCAECAQGNVDNQISLDMDANKYVCEIGHEMSQEEFDRAYNSPESTVQAPPAETPKVEPPKHEPEVLQGILQQAAINAGIEDPIAHVVPDVRVPDILNLDAILDNAIAGTSLMLPNGDMVVAVRIPETYIEAIKTQAQSQQKTFYEYFNEVLQNGIENGWFV